MKNFGTLVSIFLVFLMQNHTLLAQTPLHGSWSGAIHVQGIELGMTVHFAETNEALSATIDIPQQAAFGLQLQNVRYERPQVYFELPAGPGLAVFDGERNADTIKGAFTQGNARGTFTLNFQPQTDQPEILPEGSAVDMEDIDLITSSGTLRGTLTLPDVAPPFPGCPYHRWFGADGPRRQLGYATGEKQ